MAYDDKSPETVNPNAMATVDLDNPHSVLEVIENIDMAIAEKKAHRRQLVETYEKLMSSYAMHADKVLNRPEQGMSMGEVGVARGY